MKECRSGFIQRKEVRAMCKRIIEVLLIVSMVILIVGNILIHKGSFKVIDNKFISMEIDANSIKQWTDQELQQQNLQLLEKIKEEIKIESEVRVLYDQELQQQNLQLFEKIKNELKVESEARVSYNQELQRQNLQLEQKIQNERRIRRSLNLDLQKNILNLKQEISKLKTNLPERIQETIGSVVHIANITRGWQGSGVAWSEDIIVTARHVVEGGTDFVITLNDGTQIKATEAISSKKYDIGFIKLEEKILNPAKFGSVKDTVRGQQIYVIGSPYGKLNFNNVSLGIVSGLDRNQDSVDPYTGENYGWSVAFTTDSAGHPGNSGCPVFTIDGKVRGILVGGYSPVLIICMPVDLFMDKLSVIEMMFEQRKFYDEKSLYDYNQNYNSNEDWTPFETK